MALKRHSAITDSETWISIILAADKNQCKVNPEYVNGIQIDDGTVIHNFNTSVYEQLFINNTPVNKMCSSAFQAYSLLQMGHPVSIVYSYSKLRNNTLSQISQFK